MYFKSNICYSIPFNNINSCVFFKSTEFARITFNTLYLNTLFIIIGTVSALLVAILLYQLTNRKAIKTGSTEETIEDSVNYVLTKIFRLREELKMD